MGALFLPPVPLRKKVKLPPAMAQDPSPQAGSTCAMQDGGIPKHVQDEAKRILEGPPTLYRIARAAICVSLNMRGLQEFSNEHELALSIWDLKGQNGHSVVGMIALSVVEHTVRINKQINLFDQRAKRPLCKRKKRSHGRNLNALCLPPVVR